MNFLANRLFVKFNNSKVNNLTMKNIGYITRYFSKYEADALQLRLKELNQSEAYAIVAKIMDDIELMLTVLANAGNWI